MTKTRSAEATIKGFNFQFAASIRLILEAANGAEITLEGIEDVDVSNDSGLEAVQCKYYEGTKLTNSVLREIVEPMLVDNAARTKKISYYLYGHFNDKVEFPLTNAASFRSDVLTYRTGKGVDAQIGNVADDHDITDDQLAQFLKRLHFRYTKGYDIHRAEVVNALRSSIGCSLDEAKYFYYPNAFTLVSDIATQSTIADRTISKTEFLSRVNSKHIIFHQWLRQEVEETHYCRSMRRRFFTRSNISPFARFFIVSCDGTEPIHALKTIATAIRDKWSSHTRRRLSPPDRYAPYLLLRNVEATSLTALKAQLFAEGVKLVDGYPFFDAPFTPQHVNQDQTTENGISLRFLGDVDELKAAINAVTTRTREVYEFYRDDPLPLDFDVHHVQIPVSKATLVPKII